MSGNAMIQYDEAVQLMATHLPILGDEQRPLHECLHRILSEDVCSHLSHPSFDVSMMDGYALSFRKEMPAHLLVKGDVPAGTKWKGDIKKNECVRIYTGGVMPQGTDCVIPLEDAHETDGKVNLSPQGDYWRPFCFVRKKELDFGKGACLLRKGQRLNERHIALAAAMGHSSLRVRLMPKISFFATGDELILPSEVSSLNESQSKVVASSLYGLAAFITSHGGQAHSHGIVRDEQKQVRAALQKIIKQKTDMIVTMGGISKGAFDPLAFIAEQEGYVLRGVQMRPGKPTTFMMMDDIPILCLAGNPVSTMVGAVVFLLPMMRHMMGCTTPPKIHAKLGSAMGANGARLCFARGRLATQEDGQRWVIPYKNQDSAMMRILCLADVLIRRDSHAPPALKGDKVEIIPLAQSLAQAV